MARFRLFLSSRSTPPCAGRALVFMAFKPSRQRQRKSENLARAKKGQLHKQDTTTSNKDVAVKDQLVENRPTQRSRHSEKDLQGSQRRTRGRGPLPPEDHIELVDKYHSRPVEEKGPKKSRPRKAPTEDLVKKTTTQQGEQAHADTETRKRALQTALSHFPAFRKTLLEDASELVSCIRQINPDLSGQQDPFQEPERRADAILARIQLFRNKPSEDPDEMSPATNRNIDIRSQHSNISKQTAASHLNQNEKELLLKKTNAKLESIANQNDEYVKESITSQSPSQNYEDKQKRWIKLLTKYQILEKHGVSEKIITGIQTDIAELIATDPILNGESRWIANLEKSKISKEAFIQHTIMLKTIDRFNFEDFNNVLDFSTEATWRSPHPPTQPVELRRTMTWTPTPDLCVGFRPHQVFVDAADDVDSLPFDFMTYACPEDVYAGDANRAFPFLVLEVKGVVSTALGQEALIQSVNVASHALYNIWRYVYGNKELEAKYFQNVRIFTAGATFNKFWVRMHRAERLPAGSNSTVREDCPLGFRFEDMIELSQESYTQARVQTILKNVMRWAVKILRPILIEAVRHTFKQDRERKAAQAKPSGKGNASNARNASIPRGRSSSKNKNQQDIAQEQPPPKKRRAERANNRALADAPDDPPAGETGLTQTVYDAGLEDGSQDSEE